MRKRFVSGTVTLIIIVLVSIVFLFAWWTHLEKQPLSLGYSSVELRGIEEQKILQDRRNDESTGVTINVWTWEPKDNQQKVIDAFNADFPDIQVEFTNVQTKDMLTKLQSALVFGFELPDVVWLEIGQRGKLISLNCWEDLTDYGVDKNDLLDYLAPLSTNEKGELIGIEVSPAVAGLAYKRDLARKYFGTDDPDELERILPDWDAFIREGIRIKEESAGNVYMFPSLSTVADILRQQDSTPFIIDKDKLNLKRSMEPVLTRLLEMKKSGVVDNLTGVAFNASFAEARHIFYPCPTWGPTWRIKPNDKQSKGRWGFMQAPGGGYVMGGTIVAIPKKAKNKDAAFKYINWTYLSEKGAKANRDHLEYFSALKAIYRDHKFYSKPDYFFAGQDVMRAFAEKVMPKLLPTRPISKYDLEINDAIKLAAKTIEASKDNNIPVDELIDKMEADIVAKVPNLVRD